MARVAVVEALQLVKRVLGVREVVVYDARGRVIARLQADDIADGESS